MYNCPTCEKNQFYSRLFFYLVNKGKILILENVPHHRREIMNYIHGFGKIVVLTVLVGSLTAAQTGILVDFGPTAAENVFEITGWEQPLKSPDVAYTGAGPGGVVPHSNIGEYTDFAGVNGTPRDFVPGERIAVTWYNNADQPVTLSARISFTDPDVPGGGDVEGQWYTMRNFDDYRQTYTTVPPKTSARTVFNITRSGVHKTDARYDLVNINRHMQWFETRPKQYIICDKIELLHDADISPPEIPAAVSAMPVSDSKISLSWQRPADDTGVVEYLIYMNGRVEGYSTSEHYTAVFLQPDCTYTFTVTALDHCGNQSEHSTPVPVTTLPFQQKADLITPESFVYIGAFRLPDEFAWGGEAMTYYPGGDGGPDGPGDGFPGSLFVTDLNQPQRGFVGQVSIPRPVVSEIRDYSRLPRAYVVAQPVNIRPDNVDNWGDYVDIWRTGLEYFADEDRLYSAWSVHYTVTGDKRACISCCDAGHPAAARKYGAWHVGPPDQPPLDAMLGDYLFSLPQTWAGQNTNGRRLVTGRCRDGGLSGLGPGLYAIAPVRGTPPAAETILDYSTLLKYGPVSAADGQDFPNSIDGYLFSDDWKDACWLAAGNQAAVMIAGNKARGRHYYGYMGENMRHDWVVADVPYPDFYTTDPDGKGWMAHNFIPMAIFYGPGDLARVSRGESDTWDPQPYAAIRFRPDLFYAQKVEIRSITFDAQNRLLFVLEFDRSRDGAGIVHVFRVNNVVLSVELVFFKAAGTPNGVRLEWMTANESNNYGFYVERTAVNQNSPDWQQIGFVKGRGHSSTPHLYFFADKDIPELNHHFKYRLLQADRDGSLQYSDEVSVMLSLPSGVDLKQNYPNPFNAATHIEFTLAVDQFVRLVLFDVRGKKIKTLLSRKMPSGRHRLKVDLDHLPAGVYFYRLEGQEQKVKKAVLMK